MWPNNPTVLVNHLAVVNSPMQRSRLLWSLLHKHWAWGDRSVCWWGTGQRWCWCWESSWRCCCNRGRWQHLLWCHTHGWHVEEGRSRRNLTLNRFYSSVPYARYYVGIDMGLSFLVLGRLVGIWSYEGWPIVVEVMVELPHKNLFWISQITGF